MPCYHPLTGYQVRPGSRLSFGLPNVGARVLFVPCGKCYGCRLEHARQWAMRCVHEAKMHESNCFVTFTYDQAHLPADLSLNKRHFQLFMKCLREDLRRDYYRFGPMREPFVGPRFYMCGEYGDRHGRPHYHACIFGFYPADPVLFRRSERGDYIYTSNYIDRKWSCGSCYVGAVTFESAGYVARYVMKKVGSDGAKREIFNVVSGEVYTRNHEYSCMSLKPGVGAEWYSRYCSDVFPHDRVVVRGVKGKPPRFYDKLLGESNPELLELLKKRRIDLADLHFEDSFPKRLRVREAVTAAAIKYLKRE